MRLAHEAYGTTDGASTQRLEQCAREAVLVAVEQGAHVEPQAIVGHASEDGRVARAQPRSESLGADRALDLHDPALERVLGQRSTARVAPIRFDARFRAEALD